jgi:hypothetical protein
MQSADFDRLIANLPAGAKVSLVIVELPHASGDRADLRTPTGGVIALSSPRAPEGRVNTANSSGEQARAINDETDLSALRRKHGTEAAFKPRDWSCMTTLSEREIVRAIQSGALPATPKGDGRDHAARTVTINAMEGYLATVKAVESRTMDPPSWWDAVRKPLRKSA